MGQNAKKTRYSDEELDYFKSIVETKLQQAQDQYDFFMSQLKELTDRSDSKIKGLDDAFESSENERITNMAARQRKLIQHLQNAMIRINNKVYGICRQTGELIPKARLEAVPHATLSVEAKNSRVKKIRRRR